MFRRPSEGGKSTSVKSSTSFTASSHGAGGEKHFKVVTTKRDSMLAGVRNPAGWVTKAAEQEEETRRGEEWRSEAYVVLCLCFGIQTDAGVAGLRLSIGWNMMVSEPDCVLETFLVCI